MFDYLDRNDMDEVCFRSLNTIGWTNNMKRPRPRDQDYYDKPKIKP